MGTIEKVEVDRLIVICVTCPRCDEITDLNADYQDPDTIKDYKGHIFTCKCGNQFECV